VDAAGRINRRTMVVRRGNDSSTWNAAAGAWNKTREGYVAVLYALNMDAIWERQCLGKVPRLMAGDVTAWHLHSGDDVCHPDVKVWAELPPPWAVLAGEADCTRADVEAACRRFGVDPAQGGCTAPRPARAWRLCSARLAGSRASRPGRCPRGRQPWTWSGMRWGTP
jgi:hypothetical protein